MLATPILGNLGKRLAMRQKSVPGQLPPQMDYEHLTEHVILAGYGRVGQSIAAASLPPLGGWAPGAASQPPRPGLGRAREAGGPSVARTCAAASKVAGWPVRTDSRMRTIDSATSAV